MNILYVEDEPSDAELVKLYIRSTPHSLVLANTSREARAAFSPALDLILVDVILEHGREGYTIAHELRERGYSGPLIAVTGLATAQDQLECRRAGFSDILHKPYTIHQLAEVIALYGK
jgi:two-component system, NarL family, capsular synthesis sensor histidine kinase RcsC